MPKKKPERVRITVQLPADLGSACARAAGLDDRKLSSWVVHVLAGAVKGAL